MLTSSRTIYEVASHSSSWLGHIPLSESASVHSFPLLLMGTWVLSCRELFVHEAGLLGTFLSMPLAGHLSALLTRTDPLLGLMVNACLTLLPLPVFQSACLTLHSYQPRVRVPSGPPHPLWGFSTFFLFAVLVGASWSPVVVLTCTDDHWC